MIVQVSVVLRRTVCDGIDQGLEGYSRDPGFDPNTVRDSGKRKIS